MRFTVRNWSVRGAGGWRNAANAWNTPGDLASSGGRRRRSIAHIAARTSLRRAGAVITAGYFPFFSFFLRVRGPLPIFFESIFFAFLEGYSYAGSASSVSGRACAIPNAAAPKRPANLRSTALRRVLTRSPFATVRTRSPHEINARTAPAQRRSAANSRWNKTQGSARLRPDARRSPTGAVPCH